MSKRFLVASIAGAALLASPAHAALIAGWDFSQYAVDGFLSVDGATVTNTLVANNSALDPTNGGGVESAAFGTMYANGQFGSTLVNDSLQLAPTAGSLNSNLNNAAPDFDVDNSGEGGQIVTNFISLTPVQNQLSLVFTADLTSVPEIGQGWSVAFGGQTFEGSTNVNVLFSLDGQTYTSAGTAPLNTNDLPFSFNLTSAQAEKLFVRLDFSGTWDPNVSGDINGQPKIDNFGIYGTLTAIPEPGTMALLLSGLAGLVAVGRRRD